MNGRDFRAASAAILMGCSAGSVFFAPSAEAAAPAKAPEKAADVRARALFQKGDTAYAEGRYEEAYAAFAEAYDLSGRPQLLFNVSNALERLGRYVEAVDALEKYLASGKAKDRDVVQKRLTNLRRRVEEQKAEEANEEEKRAHEREEAKKAADAAVAEAATREPTPPTERPTRILPIVVLGAGAAALATSAVFGALTLSARSDADAGCKDAEAGRLCSADARSAIDRDKTFGLVTDVALVSGVVLGGLGVYLLLSGDDRPVETSAGARAQTGSTRGERQSRALRIEARPAGAGVEVVGRF